MYLTGKIIKKEEKSVITHKQTPKEIFFYLQRPMNDVILYHQSLKIISYGKQFIITHRSMSATGILAGNGPGGRTPCATCIMG